MAPNLRPTYPDGLRIIDAAEGWPKTHKAIAELLHAKSQTVGRAANSLIKYPPQSKNSALIIWCRMCHQGQNERYVEILGYDPWRNQPREGG